MKNKVRATPRACHNVRCQYRALHSKCGSRCCLPAVSIIADEPDTTRFVSGGHQRARSGQRRALTDDAELACFWLRIPEAFEQLSESSAQARACSASGYTGTAKSNTRNRIMIPRTNCTEMTVSYVYWGLGCRASLLRPGLPVQQPPVLEQSGPLVVCCWLSACDRDRFHSA